MKIALICASNLLFTGYVDRYERILKENNTNYTVINWDRFQMEDESDEFKYRDKKIGHRRNYFDYLKFKKFVIKKLDENKYDKIVVISLQLAYFLSKYLTKNYSGRYIIDIRDHHAILKFTNMKKIVEKSSFTVISSPAYKLWLPKIDKYIVNHNTGINNLDELRSIESKLNTKEIKIACIGAIRDYGINISFIDSLKNSKNIKLFFHGEGTASEGIISHVRKNGINNVWITGRYYKTEEEGLYIKSDLINALVPNNEINSKTLLSFRLYNASLYGKPIIALEGTYLSELVEKYNLGLVLNSFEGVEDKINRYLSEFNAEIYERGRSDFIQSVIEDNKKFKRKVEGFILNQ